MTHPAVVAFLTAGLVSALAQPLLVSALPRWGVLDVPNARSAHCVPTPRGGGLGVAAGMTAGWAAWMLLGAGEELAWLTTSGSLLCLAALACVGLWDDVRGVPALTRLVVMLVAGVVVAALLEVGPLAAVLVAIWFTAFTNAFNFMDGVDGMSGLNAFVAATWFAGLGVVGEDALLTLIGSLLAGAAAGFLPFNLPRARIFLGDSGSYLLGSGLALAAVLVLIADRPLLFAIAPLVPYLADTGWTLLRRAARGEHLLRPHRGHTYQRIVASGRSHLWVATSVTAMATLCCVIVATLPTWVSAALLCGLSVTYLAAPTLVAATTKAEGHVP